MFGAGVEKCQGGRGWGDGPSDAVGIRGRGRARSTRLGLQGPFVIFCRVFFEPQDEVATTEIKIDISEEYINGRTGFRGTAPHIAAILRSPLDLPILVNKMKKERKKENPPPSGGRCFLFNTSSSWTLNAGVTVYVS